MEELYYLIFHEFFFFWIVPYAVWAIPKSYRLWFGYEELFTEYTYDEILDYLP